MQSITIQLEEGDYWRLVSRAAFDELTAEDYVQGIIDAHVDELIEKINAVEEFVKKLNV